MSLRKNCNTVAKELLPNYILHYTVLLYSQGHSLKNLKRKSNCLPKDLKGHTSVTTYHCPLSTLATGPHKPHPFFPQKLCL